MTSAEVPGQFDDLVLTERRGETLVVTLNKPGRLNALSPALSRRLTEVLHTAAEPDVRGVVLTGAGRGFCAGVDLDADPAERVNPVRSRPRYEFSGIVLQLAGLGKPVVAAVNGPAAGAGLGLACAADLRLASPSAAFVPAFAKIGSVPDMGVSFHLTRIIGYERSLEWLLRGDRMSAEDAERIGLVQRIVAPEELVDAAVETCEAMTTTTPTAVRLTKQLLRNAATGSLADQLELEATYQLLAVEDPGRADARSRVVDSLNTNRASQ